MLATTSRGYPYPAITDQPDGPAQIRALAAAIDADANPHVTTDWNTAIVPGRVYYGAGALNGPPIGTVHVGPVFSDGGSTLHQVLYRSTLTPSLLAQWMRVSIDGGTTWSAWQWMAGPAPRAEYTEATGGTTLGTVWKALGVSTKLVDTLGLSYAGGTLTVPDGPDRACEISAQLAAGGSTTPCGLGIGITINGDFVERALVDFNGLSGPATVDVGPREFTLHPGDAIQVQGFCSVGGYTTSSTQGYAPHIRIKLVA